MVATAASWIFCRAAGGVHLPGAPGYDACLFAACGANYACLHERRAPPLALQPACERDVVLAVLAVAEGRRRGLWPTPGAPPGAPVLTVCGGGHSELCVVHGAVLLHMRRMRDVRVVGAGGPDPAVEIDNGPHQGRVLQRIAPASYTPGHARLMPVAMKETSAQRAATHGWPAFIPAFTPPKIGGTEPFVHVKKFFDIYHAKLTAAGHSDEVVKSALDWTTHTYQCVHVAESDDQAREELEVILKDYQAAVEREAEFNARAESNAENTKTDRTPNALTEDWIGTWCLYGSPETVIEHLRPYKELGIGNVLCGTTTGPLTEERLRLGNQTLDLLAREVMPALA